VTALHNFRGSNGLKFDISPMGIQCGSVDRRAIDMQSVLQRRLLGPRSFGGMHWVGSDRSWSVFYFGSSNRWLSAIQVTRIEVERA
jgi:hypothetical protein